MNSLGTDFNIKDDTLEDKTLPLENSDIILYPTPPTPSPLPQTTSTQSPVNLESPLSPDTLEDPLKIFMSISQLNRAMGSRIDSLLQSELTDELRNFNTRINSALAAVQLTLSQHSNPYSNPETIIEETKTTKNDDKPTNFCWGKINAPVLIYSPEDVIAGEFNKENDFEVELVKRQ